MDEHELVITGAAGAAYGVTKAILEVFHPKSRVRVRNLPPRNANFTGREELLDSLHKALSAGKTTAVTQAIAGLGGIGKTQLATEYCNSHADDYRVIWWLRAEDPATLASDYAALAGKLNLPEKDSADQTRTIAAVRTCLEQNKSWLLVFDNAPGPAAIRDYLPRACPGRVIVTSRHPHWGGIAKTLEVPVLPRVKSVEFLLKRTKTGDSVAAGRLAEDLGDLPLALEQAGAYIEETGTSMEHYREVLAMGRKDVLKWRSQNAQYPESVSTTWQVSFQRLEEESKPGAVLLNVAAFLAPDDIPLDLLISKDAGLPKELATLAERPVEFDQARMALGRFSLARFQGNDMTVHRLVQAVVRDHLNAGEEAKWAVAAATLVNSRFPLKSDDVRTWPDCTRLLAHAVAAANYAVVHGVAFGVAGRLLHQVGLYSESRAQYRAAEPFYKRALVIWEKALGPDHPDVAETLDNLALLYDAEARYAQAEPLYKRALAIWEKALGPDHPDVALSLNNLAELLCAQGQDAQAEPLHKRALAIREKALGPDHPDVALSLNNLAKLYRTQGQYAQAEPLLKRALVIWEKALGPDHPDVATCLENMAALCRATNRAEEANALDQRAARIRAITR